MQHLLLLPTLLLALPTFEGKVPSAPARELAKYTRETYADQAVKTLAELLRFDTFKRPDVANAEHPSFRAMSAYLKEWAGRAGLDFADHGAVVVLGLGRAEQRLGVVTHGDVQPAEATKWARDPFELDLESEPGRLVGRGTEDDKGPIVCAMYAMRAIAEKGLPLARRIELIISYTEESDWSPFIEFLGQNPPPELNVAFDAEYPVVVAEKGWCSVQVSLPMGTPPVSDAYLASFTGGFFLSQVPEDAQALIANPGPGLETKLLAAARSLANVRFDFTPSAGELHIRARGTSAHSSKPWEGHNAITHLAELLSVHDWPQNGPAWMVDFLRERCGTGYLAERFGDVAYEDDFMGPLTLSVGTLQETDGRLVGAVNLRRPVGRSAEEMDASIRAALESWRSERGLEDVELTLYVGEPHPPQDAQHVPVLLDTFRHYTGQSDAEPISIGGGTHARLVPGGVNFGPSMPGEPYSGHSEHEFLTRAQFDLNLEMTTSLLVDLAGE